MTTQENSDELGGSADARNASSGKQSRATSWWGLNGQLVRSIAGCRHYVQKPPASLVHALVFDAVTFLFGSDGSVVVRIAVVTSRWC